MDFFDELNIKRLFDKYKFTVKELKIKSLSEIKKISDFLEIIFDGITDPETMQRWIKAIKCAGQAANTDHLLYDVRDTFENGGADVLRTLRSNCVKLISPMPYAAGRVFVTDLIASARFRYFGQDGVRELRRYAEAAASGDREAVYDAFAAIVRHSLTTPYFIDRIASNELFHQALVMSNKEEMRYKILEQLADQNETAAMIAGDYYSNINDPVKACRIYLRQSDSSYVMTDIALFLVKTRKKQLNGVITSEQMNKTYLILRSKMEIKLNKITAEDPERYEDVRLLSGTFAEYYLAFRILYTYGIEKENITMAANGCLSMIKRGEIVPADKNSEEAKAALERIVAKAENIACGRCDLNYYSSKCTGLVNRLEFYKDLRLPGSPEAGEKMSEDEYSELKENLEYLSEYYPVQKFNLARLHYVEYTTYGEKTGYDYKAELALLESAERAIPEEDRYKKHCRDFRIKILEEYKNK